ncbi:hypothetical protein U1Q18_046113 [Sarracenia purpurea var. burkii]
MYTRISLLQPPRMASPTSSGPSIPTTSSPPPMNAPSFSGTLALAIVITSCSNVEFVMRQLEPPF